MSNPLQVAHGIGWLRRYWTARSFRLHSWHVRAWCRSATGPVDRFRWCSSTTPRAAIRNDPPPRQCDAAPCRAGAQHGAPLRRCHGAAVPDQPAATFTSLPTRPWRVIRIAAEALPDRGGGIGVVGDHRAQVVGEQADGIGAHDRVHEGLGPAGRAIQKQQRRRIRVHDGNRPTHAVQRQGQESQRVRRWPHQMQHPFQ